MAKNSGVGCVALGAIVLVLYAAAQVKESIGDTMFRIIIIAVIAVVILLAVLHGKTKKRLRKERIAQFYVKYGDEEIVNRIIARNYWQGQTAEMLVDSLGNPSGKDEAMMKTKVKETWKYFPDGSNKYKLRIILEDGIVVGWESRD